jgi:hypothetical protein
MYSGLTWGTELQTPLLTAGCLLRDGLLLRFLPFVMDAPCYLSLTLKGSQTMLKELFLPTARLCRLTYELTSGINEDTEIITYYSIVVHSSPIHKYPGRRNRLERRTAIDFSWTRDCLGIV